MDGQRCTTKSPIEDIVPNGNPDMKDTYQGPHDWRKRLRPVQSPVKCESLDSLLTIGDGRVTPDDKLPRSPRPLPPWKRDLIEKNKKVAKLVRRESSGKSKKTPIVRRDSSGRSKRPPGSESPSVRKTSFKSSGQADSAFTQQVVNENSGSRRRISPANSFKNASSVRRTPSDKVLDPNDPSTKKRMERVRRARLYLLQQMGPNAFLIVGDMPEHKFKVIIGPQTCTCSKGPHCVHVLFVMLRVFQVNETEQCLWSRQLKNYEVDNLFRLYNDRRTLKIEAKSRKYLRSSSRLPFPEETPVPSESDSGSIREEDDTCPICLLEMVEGESLLKCEACQNKLHHHCITVWFEECKRQNDPLICPLCRSRWKSANMEGKCVEQLVELPVAPPNTRVPSPQLEVDSPRLPYAEPIPQEHVSLATPWIQNLGVDLVACLFSRNWSIRETGLKHLAKEMAQQLLGVTKDNNIPMSLGDREAMIKLLECCFSVVAFMCQDPVYRVFVGCLKVIRTVFGVIPLRDCQERNELQKLFRPVVDAIIFRCTDGNRRTGELSISTMLEIAKGQHGELCVGRELANPGQFGLGGMLYLVGCLTDKYDPSSTTWQWLLGRLYIIERLIMDFPTEFSPRQRPDGASSESSLELIGATSKDDIEQPHHYERLLNVAEFAVKAVSNHHARISRVARRVFLLAARYAAHLENFITELTGLLSGLEFSHRKSLKRQLDMIVEEFHMSEQFGRSFLTPDTDKDTSPSATPSSSPRCVSPLTVSSDTSCKVRIQVSADLLVPPNTPISYRRQCLEDGNSLNSNIKDSVEEVQDFHPLVASRSVDNLDSLCCKPRKRLSESPVVNHKKTKVKSIAPAQIGKVLETNLDEVIKLEEKARQRAYSTGKIDKRASLFIGMTDELRDAEDGYRLCGENIVTGGLPMLPQSPPPRLLSQDIETDIDSEDMKTDNLLIEKHFSNDIPSASQHISNGDSSGKLHTHSLQLSGPPNIKHAKVSKNLTIDLEAAETGQRSKRSISPCAHITELERFSILPTVTEACNTLSSTGNLACTSASGFECEATPCRGKLVKQVSTDNIKNSCTSASKTCGSRRTSHSSDDLNESLATTPCVGREKPVTFKSEVAMATPKHSPSHTLDKDEDDCHCKEEVEKEEALALARAMEVSCLDPPRPVVPGLTPLDQEEVITIKIQPENCDAVDSIGSTPTLYCENTHWVKGALLGTGAFSTCYQARDVKSGTIMALKQISFCRNSKTEQETVISSITEEIQMMAKLNHPHIVRILGATRQGCHFNMFVEWMPGGSVSYLLGLYGKFSEDVIITYMLQILRGLAYLHENQILHRDLKGANLLIDSTGQRLRIGDFGAAARLASKTTGAGEFQGQLLGTIAFMAPEVLRGENYGRGCDVWSVGCCMIEMATTKPPWNAHDISNHLALIFKIANAQSTPPIPDKLSPPLRDLLLRCVEPVKEQRPSAKELLIHPLFTQYMQRKQ